MPHLNDIRDQLKLLAAYRQTLCFLLEQAIAYGGEPLAPPQTRAGLVQMRAGVTQCKRVLRGWGLAIKDRPEDEAAAPLDPQRALQAASDTIPDAYAQYRAYLLRLLPPLDAQATPYLGLQTFQFEHADRFFGRDRLVGELVERLGRSPFLAVLGTSGSGKSSVVRAGLLPLLKAGGLPGSERWHSIIVRPGSKPLDALVAALSTSCGCSLIEALDLAARLASDDHALQLIAHMFQPRLVLVVDQAEELWTLQPADPAQRAQWQEKQQRPFLRLLLSALTMPDQPLLVILAMRTDFLHRACDEPGFAQVLADHDVIVSPPVAEELRAAVVLPAQQAGGTFEPGLVDELIVQTQGESGALPLLEYTLQELWQYRQANGLMTWASYRALGGVEGALAKQADSMLQKHYSATQQQELRRVLLRLIQPGEGFADTRRRVSLAELAAADQSPEAVQQLLQPLIDARLLTSGQDQGQQPRIEISHEALIRSWPILHSWIDEARTDLRLQIQVEEAAKEWQHSEADTSLLWDGLKLSTAEAWVARAQPRLSTRDAAFLEASRAKAQRQKEQEAQAERDRQRLAEEQRNTRRLRRFLIIAGVLLVIALTATLEAVHSQQQAEQARSTAEVARTTAVAAQATAEQGRLRANASGATAIAAERTAVTAQKTAITASSLGDAQRLSYAAAFQRSDASELALLLASEAASRGVSSTTHQTLRDALDQYPVRVRILVGHSNPVRSAVFSPDGQRIVTVSDDGTARLWSLDGRQLAILQGHTQAVRSVMFSSDGRYIVTASEDHTARVWNADGTSFSTLEGHTEGVRSAIFSPEGRRIVTASDDGTARVWGIYGTLTATMEGHRAVVRAAGFSPDGNSVVTAGDDGSTRVWDA